jgi:hypothetical protein
VGFLRHLLLTLNRHGRALEGSAAYPPPPELFVPPALKDGLDAQDPEEDDPDA